MTHIQQVIQQINSSLPEGVQMVAVSKFHPAEMIMEAYEAGQRLFGENHVQEMQQKHESLPQDIEWHFIGHLQTNKVKYIAPYVSMIHAVDTPKLLAEINKQAVKNGRVIPCLLELHLAQEETKYGFSIEECDEYLASGAWRELQGVHISGIMCMASNVDDEAQIAEEFDRAKRFFDHARECYFADDPEFKVRSWGMSDDYPVAIRHGSTIIRVGSKIFGPRVY